MTRSPTPAVRAASEPRYKGSWTASVAIVKPTAMVARIQRLARVSKATDISPHSIRYGEKAAVNNTTWLVIGKYRDAKARLATVNATMPVTAWVVLDTTVQSVCGGRFVAVAATHSQAGSTRLGPGRILLVRAELTCGRSGFKRSPFGLRGVFGISCAVACTGRRRRCSPHVIASFSRAHRVLRCRAHLCWTQPHRELFVVAQRQHRDVDGERRGDRRPRRGQPEPALRRHRRIGNRRINAAPPKHLAGHHQAYPLPGRPPYYKFVSHLQLSKKYVKWPKAKRSVCR